MANRAMIFVILLIFDRAQLIMKHVSDRFNNPHLESLIMMLL